LKKLDERPDRPAIQKPGGAQPVGCYHDKTPFARQTLAGLLEAWRRGEDGRQWWMRDQLDRATYRQLSVHDYKILDRRSPQQDPESANLGADDEIDGVWTNYFVEIGSWPEGTKVWKIRIDRDFAPEGTVCIVTSVIEAR
jgi:hypothetical protein